MTKKFLIAYERQRPHDGYTLYVQLRGRITHRVYLNREELIELKDVVTKVLDNDL